MNNKDRRISSVSRRPQQFVMLAGALIFVLIATTGGCQGRRDALSEPARILADSLRAANEAMYTSSDPNLGYDRLGCVEERAMAKLGLELVERISDDIARGVRLRHSRSEWEKVNKGLMGDHPYSTPEFCARIDSLWYARIAAKPIARP
jgi:hypothetical protein